MSQRIRIDLQERLRGGSVEPVNVNIQWRIGVTEDKPGFLAKLFRKQTHVHKQVDVQVGDYAVPEELVLSDRGSLFEIVYKDQRSPRVTIDMSDKSDQFQLLFNPGKIIDCTREQDAEPRIYTIGYSITWSDDTSATPKTDKYELEVEMAPFKLDPEIEIENLEDEFQYRYDMGTQQLCDIVVRQPEQAKYHFTPKQKMRLRLELKRNGSTKDITNRLHLVNAQGGISEEFELREEVRIPVFVDFSEFTNPADDSEDYIVVPKVDVYACHSPQELKPQAFENIEFELLKDPQGTELQIDTRSGNNARVKFENPRSGIHAEMQFVPRSTLGMPVTIFLTNLATDKSNRKAGLRIKNLRVSHQLASSGIRLIEKKDGKLYSLNDSLDKLFSLEGKQINDLLDGNEVFVPNGKDKQTGENSQTDIVLKLKPERLSKVTLGEQNVHDFKITTTISFDYWEDGNGVGDTSDATKKTASVQINWDLHLRPNPEWLCIDYGSSAIVCRYDEEVSDLHTRKKNIFKNYQGGKFREATNDSSEKDSPFLSSDIVLTHQSGENTTSSLFTEQDPKEEIVLDNLAVSLSPTQGLIKDAVENQLPCLKILVGNEALPPKPAYLEYQYRRKGRNGIIELVTMDEAEKNEEENSLMRIFNIFSEAYGELIHFYIAPETKGKDINKLVLTYPTTYTPRHLRLLKDIVKANFKDLHPDYLKFVCESDAVAAYYINNWGNFNDKKRSIYDDDETLLVFDMGAGTLDLTLFKKTVNPNGKIQVEIIAKIGTGKAGNYLDYVIAEIMADPQAEEASKYKTILSALVNGETELVKEIVSLNTPSKNLVRDARMDLKRLIKDVIKPNLVAGNQIKDTFVNHLNKRLNIELNCDDIIKHRLFQAYLNDVCGKLIDNLCSNASGKDKDFDRILISGRGCRLQAIRTALQGRGNKGAMKLVSFRDETHKAKDADKTAVVEGAMAYADSFSSEDSPTQVKSRRLYANYGLAYWLHGKWEYVELLNSNELPMLLNSERLDMYQGRSKQIKGMMQAQKLYVIQTYMDEQNTAAALNSNDYEFITIMEKVSTDNFDRHKRQNNVRLVINYNNDIILNVDGIETQGTSPRGDDLTSEITRRSVWPVII